MHAAAFKDAPVPELHHATCDPHPVCRLHASTFKDAFALPELHSASHVDSVGDLRAGHPVHAPAHGHPAALRELRHATRDPDALPELHPAAPAPAERASAGGSA